MGPVYRVGDKISPEHIDLIKERKYRVKSIAALSYTINDESDFAFKWNFETGFVLARYAGFGRLAILDECLVVEYPNTNELYLELHVEVNGGGKKKTVETPSTLFKKWFLDDSCTKMVGDGEIDHDDLVPDLWEQPRLGKESVKGAWRFSINPGEVAKRRVYFGKNFQTPPGVKLALLSRNIPEDHNLGITIGASQIDRQCFTISVTTQPPAIYVRCVVGWEAMEVEPASG
ncbi:h-type lectin domain-containing protein [Hirsutella rhossiliensis]|uniref:H-type lectin domain-containing protein n=1 Tax=Hirsutella rhossiliensis TaxID=111463 RepID=A0A9P8MQH0_9HYPO|nr:h-type lectin domain-containing protein [Hirsutella rhossiliensis]KAH0959567.1 h-type lectin domain-containing protein [Hirsutella rhossiliensis]